MTQYLASLPLYLSTRVCLPRDFTTRFGSNSSVWFAPSSLAVPPGDVPFLNDSLAEQPGGKQSPWEGRRFTGYMLVYILWPSTVQFKNWYIWLDWTAPCKLACLVTPQHKHIAGPALNSSRALSSAKLTPNPGGCLQTTATVQHRWPYHSLKLTTKPVWHHAKAKLVRLFHSVL